MAIEMRQDGGWAWCICVGSFIVSFVASVYLNCGGVVLSALVDNYGIPRSEAGKCTDPRYINKPSLMFCCNYIACNSCSDTEILALMILFLFRFKNRDSR